MRRAFQAGDYLATPDIVITIAIDFGGAFYYDYNHNDCKTPAVGRPRRERKLCLYKMIRMLCVKTLRQKLAIT
jgi:hypothetical protein